MRTEAFDALVLKLQKLDFADVKQIVVETKKWVESLSEEEKKAKIIGISASGTIVLTREEIPDMLEKDPKFRAFWIKSLKEYYDFFLGGEGRGVKRGARRQGRELLSFRFKIPEEFKILLTDCSDWGDTATWIAGAFYRELMAWAEDIGYKVIKLMHEEVVRDTWDATLVNNPDIVLISHCGHGNYTTVTGYNLSVLAKVGEYNPELYKGKVASWLSCEMGKKLLSDMVDKGLVAGDGYEEVYYFWYQGKEPPNEDPYAKSFIGTHLNTTRLLLLGHTYKEAFEETNRLYEQEAMYWREHGAPDVAATLLYDRSIHVLKGDPNWCLPILEEVPVEITLNVDYRVWEEAEERIVLWSVYGEVRSSEGPMSDVSVLVRVGEESYKVKTDEEGKYSFKVKIKYPPRDIEEHINVKFDGCIRDRKRYLPSENSKVVKIPLEKVLTEIEILKTGYKKLAFDNYEYIVKAQLKEKDGRPLSGRSIFLEVEDDCGSVCTTNAQGVCTNSATCWIEFWKALWAWLFGRKVKFVVRFAGDATHLGCVAEGYIKVKGILF